MENLNLLDLLNRGVHSESFTVIEVKEAPSSDPKPQRKSSKNPVDQDQYLRDLLKEKESLEQEQMILNQLLKKKISSSDFNNRLIRKKLDHVYQKKFRVVSRIRKIDPTLFPKKTIKSDGIKRFTSLSTPSRFSNKTLIDIIAGSSGEEITVDPLQKLQLFRDCIPYLSKQQALYIHLRFNEGLTLAEIERRTGKHNIHSTIKRGLQTLGAIYTIKSQIAQMYQSNTFSLQDLLDHNPEILTEVQMKIIRALIDDTSHRIFTYEDLLMTIGYPVYKYKKRKSEVLVGDRKLVGLLKGKLMVLGINEKDLDSIHYLMKKSKVILPKSKQKIGIGILSRKRGSHVSS